MKFDYWLEVLYMELRVLYGELCYWLRFCKLFIFVWYMFFNCLFVVIFCLLKNSRVVIFWCFDLFVLVWVFFNVLNICEN